MSCVSNMPCHRLRSKWVVTIKNISYNIIWATHAVPEPVMIYWEVVVPLYKLLHIYPTVEVYGFFANNSGKYGMKVVFVCVVHNFILIIVQAYLKSLTMHHSSEIFSI